MPQPRMPQARMPQARMPQARMPQARMPQARMPQARMTAQNATGQNATGQNATAQSGQDGMLIVVHVLLCLYPDRGAMEELAMQGAPALNTCSLLFCSLDGHARKWAAFIRRQQVVTIWLPRQAGHIEQFGYSPSPPPPPPPPLPQGKPSGNSLLSNQAWCTSAVVLFSSN